MFEDELFTGYQPLPDQLEAFGFRSSDQGWLYTQDLLDGQLEARITVTKAGRVIGRVLDKELMEDYAPLRQKQVRGSFVGQVREAYESLLERIKSSCFRPALPRSEQDQRLRTYLEETYGDYPAQPFTKYPNVWVFRHPSNQKWYALLMAISPAKLGLPGREEVPILNVKVPPDRVPSLLARTGFYPSYHMNKNHWVTLVLDDGLADDQVFALVDGSRQLLATTGGLRRKRS